MDPVRHAELAASLPLPTSAFPTPLTDRQIANLQRMATNPTELYESAKSKLQRWTRRKEELKAVNTMYRSSLEPTQLATIGKVDIFLLEEMMVYSKHGDHRYIQDMVTGFPVTDSIPSGDCGILILGGQRVRGQPGLGGPEPIAELRAQCGATNHATLKSAKARVPRTDQ